MEELKRFLEDESLRRERFYETMDEQIKAEFINGKMLVSKEDTLAHNQTSIRLMTLLSAFIDKYDLGMIGVEKLFISLTRNDYEPDICFFTKERADEFTEGQMKFPAPDFIVEVLSPSTEERDRGVKFEDYEAHGVREYWIADPKRKTIEQYKLVRGKYTLIQKSGSGTVKSFTVKGFAMPVRAAFYRDDNTQALREIMLHSK
jgi:Uma2 family endonuclease